MAKMRRAKKTPAAQVVAPPVRNYPRKAVIALAAALFVGLAFAAYAGNPVLHGHVSITEHRSATPSKAGVSVPTKAVKAPEAPAGNQSASSPSLVDKYGDAAKSSTVASAIRDIEAKSPSKGAVASADRYEALLHGHPMPGTDPTSLLMAGYVPPGMDPYTASMLSRSLPKLPRMPRTGPLTPEEIDQMAGMPADPQDAVLASLGTSRTQIDAANQAQFERYMREEHGPIYVPPLHASHEWLAQHAIRTKNGFVAKKDFDGSIREMTDQNGNVVSEITYDPWGVPTQIAGSGPLPDKLFQGMYYHPRSGNYLTLNRAYNPTLGRWLSRDPLGESAGTNLYAFVRNNPISLRDPLGLDVWIEGSAGFPEAAFHESINVGNPNGDYYSQSYGLAGPWYGQVYTDPMHGGFISQYAKSTPAQDEMIKQQMMKDLGTKGSYDPMHQCRSYSEQKFKDITKQYGLTPSAPPNRPVDPYTYTQYIPIVAPTTSTTAATTIK